MTIANTPALVQTLDWVAVETDPTYVRHTTDDSGLPYLVVADEWTSLPTRYLDALRVLIDGDPGDPTRCYRCGTQAVGWADEARHDKAGREYDVTVWRYAALVANPDGGPVSVQCEDCGPDVTPAPPR